jgi:hypothetical protein
VPCAIRRPFYYFILHDTSQPHLLGFRNMHVRKIVVDEE